MATVSMCGPITASTEAVETTRTTYNEWTKYAGIRSDMVIRDRGATVLLVEHDMRAVMRISDRILRSAYGSPLPWGGSTSLRRHTPRSAAMRPQP